MGPVLEERPGGLIGVNARGGRSSFRPFAFEHPSPGYHALMGIGTSIFLIAVGAVLKWAVTGSVEGLKIETLGLILMVVGVLGLLISMYYTEIYARRRDRLVADRDVVPPADVPPRA